MLLDICMDVHKFCLSSGCCVSVPYTIVGERDIWNTHSNEVDVI